MPGYASFTVEKKNGSLIYKDYGCYENRNPSMFWILEQADKIYNFPDFPETEFRSSDGEDLDFSVYSISKFGSTEKLIPCFGFHNWKQTGVNDFEETVAKVSATGDLPYDEHKVGWIGNIAVTDILPTQDRRRLWEIGQQNSHLFDIISMNWLGNTPDNLFLKSTQYLSYEELVKKYSILIDVRGGGYSGRTKFLLWSKRPLLISERPCKEFFWKNLKPWEHYIPVKEDLSDVVEKAQWCIDNYEEACKIANNAYEFCKIHVSRDACYTRWNEIITEIINKKSPQ